MIDQGRRIAVRIIGVGLMSAFALVWYKLVGNYLQILKPGKRILPLNKTKAVSFYDDFIVVNQENHTAVLSSRCQHLGCKISSTRNNRLVCPCHGSEYDLSGKVIKGPAFKDLEKIPFKIDSDGKQIEIES